MGPDKVPETMRGPIGAELTMQDLANRAQGRPQVTLQQPPPPKEQQPTGLSKWQRLVVLLAGYFKRGQNRDALVKAWGLAGDARACPRVTRPSATRMVVYSATWLGQSFRTHAVRYDALLLLHKTL